MKKIDIDYHGCGNCLRRSWSYRDNRSKIVNLQKREKNLTNFRFEICAEHLQKEDQNIKINKFFVLEIDIPNEATSQQRLRGFITAYIKSANSTYAKNIAQSF